MTARRDTSRDKDLADAKRRKKEKDDAFDIKVRRLYENDHGVEGTARILGKTTGVIMTSLRRMGLKPTKACRISVGE
jgi:hypothetical protein